MSEKELKHYGVKGMKWGVRRYQNSDGSLNAKGVEKYAKKGYARDSMRNNRTVAGKIYDAYTGAHKIDADIHYEQSSDKANRKRAEQYLKEQKRNSASAKNTIKKGAQVTAKVMNTVGRAYLTDQLFFGGAGTKAATMGAKYAANAMADKMFNTTVIDKNGRVVYRYNS